MKPTIPKRNFLVSKKAPTPKIHLNKTPEINRGTFNPPLQN
jgi:hypothetical protein